MVVVGAATEENKTSGIVAQAYNPRYHQAEAGGSLQAKNHCDLHKEFKTNKQAIPQKISQSYIVIQCFRTNS